jgi:hypothetical protein
VNFFYTFEDGRKSFILNNGGTLIYENRINKVKYELGLLLKAKFIDTANNVRKKGEDRPNKYFDWRNYISKMLIYGRRYAGRVL